MSENANPIVSARVTRIEDKIDRATLNNLPTSSAAGGMAFGNMNEILEFAKLMSIADVAIPKHLRTNIGACLAICIQAVEWRMSPFAVANKSYVVNDRVSYESQLIHAVIEQRAPLLGRLRHRYTGEGDQRRCIVWASVKGETEPLEFQSAEFGRIQPKNSPLWKTKPDLQLFYNASRDWARVYFPDVIMGVYSDDELAGELQPPAKTAETVDLNRRLAGQSAVVIEPPVAATAEPEKQTEQADEPKEQPTAAVEPTTTASSKDPADYSDEAAWYEACELAAADNNHPPVEFKKMFGPLKASTKIASTRKSEYGPARATVLAAFRENRVTEDGKIVDAKTGEVK